MESSIVLLKNLNSPVTSHRQSLNCCIVCMHWAMYNVYRQTDKNKLKYPKKNWCYGSSAASLHAWRNSVSIAWLQWDKRWFAACCHVAVTNATGVRRWWSASNAHRSICAQYQRLVAVLGKQSGNKRRDDATPVGAWPPTSRQVPEVLYRRKIASRALWRWLRLVAWAWRQIAVWI